MRDAPNVKRSKPGPERSQAPLWLAILGLGVALYSRSIKDPMIGNVVFWAGVVWSAVAVVYWFVRPKQGM